MISNCPLKGIAVYRVTAGALTPFLFACFVPAICLNLASPVWGDPSAPDISTLHLTWQRDPTTTMTIQWMEHGLELPLAEGQNDMPTALDLPRLPEPSIDGSLESWEGNGLRIAYLANASTWPPAEEALTADLRLGWHNEGLLLYARVRDSHAAESDNDRRLWEGDSIEVHVAALLDSPHRYQFIVAPGMSAEHPEPRQQFRGPRAGAAGDELSATVQRVKEGEEYILELLLPWSNLGVTPSAGEAIYVQVGINDLDTGRVRRFAWHPAQQGEELMPLRLADTGEVVSPARATVSIGRDNRPIVRLAAPPGYAGQVVELHAGPEQLTTATLEETRGTARAHLALPDPPAGGRWGAVEVRFPDGSLATTVVPWEMFSAAPETRRLSYRMAGGGTQTHAESTVSRIDAFPWFIQRVELSNLEPGEEYLFSVEGSDETFRFRTAPAALDEPIRFANGGDVATGSTAARMHGVLAARNPLFAVVGGDLAYADGARIELKVQYLRQWHEHMRAPDGRLIPHIAAIGNHEVRGGYNRPRTDAPFFYGLFGGLFPENGFAALDFGNYLTLILLDTNHTTPIAGQQTEWLEKTLSDRRQVPHVFPVYHVPAWPSHRPFEGTVSVSVREHWVPLFETYGVRTVFENHDHTYKRTHPLRGGQVDEQSGVVYLGDGAWGVRPREVHADRWYLSHTEAVNHAMIVTLDEDSRHVEVLNVSGTQIDELKQEK